MNKIRGLAAFTSTDPLSQLDELIEAHVVRCREFERIRLESAEREAALREENARLTGELNRCSRAILLERWR